MPNLLNPFRFGVSSTTHTLESAKGTVDWLTTDAVSTTFTVNISFKPVLVIVHVGSLRTGGVSGANSIDQKNSFGCATSTSSRFCVITQEDDGAANAANGSADRDDAVAGFISTSNAFGDGLLDIDAMTWDGANGVVRFIVDEVLSVNKTVHYLILGGLTQEAAITSHTEPGTTGSHTITAGLADAHGFIFASAAQTGTLPSVAGHWALSLGGVGVADSSQFVIMTGSENGPTATDTTTYQKLSECIALPPVSGDPNSCSWRESFTSVSGTTVTLNCIERESTRRYWCVALKNISVQAISGTMDTTSGSDTVITTGFRPKAGLWMTGFIGESTADTPSANLRLSVGHHASDSGSAGCWGSYTPDAQGTTACGSVVYTGSHISSWCNTIGSVQAFIDVVAIADTSITLDNADPNPSSFLQMGLVFGDLTV